MDRRFKKLSDGTIILDHKTGLEWQEASAGPMTWDEAMDYAEELDLGGYNDWRLPTRAELETLLDLDRYNPASAFPGMPSGTFWSSSVYANGSSFTWGVGFDGGYVYNGDKDYPYHVRCVRRGPLKYRHSDTSDSIHEPEAEVERLRLLGGAKESLTKV